MGIFVVIASIVVQVSSLRMNCELCQLSLRSLWGESSRLKVLFWFCGFCEGGTEDAGLHPQQLTAYRAPSFYGVHSPAVASYTEGLLVEHSSLQSPASIFLSSVRLPLAAMTTETDHGGNK